MKTITTEGLIYMILNTNNFIATFIKKNGAVRTMDCLFESARYLEKSGVITVFDTQLQNYRSINVNTLQRLSVKNCTYVQIEKNIFEAIKDKNALIATIENILGMSMSKMQKAWSYEQLNELYEKLLELDEYDLNATKAMNEYQNGIDLGTISEIEEGYLEFIPNMTLHEVAQTESFSILIPVPEYINSSYADYVLSEEDLEEYYAQTSFGVIQIQRA